MEGVMPEWYMMRRTVAEKFYGQNKLPRMPYASESERMVVVATK